MKISYSKWMYLLNEKLAEHGQETRVVEYKKDYLRLSTAVLQGSEVKKFKGRVMTKKTTHWVANMDKLLSGDMSVGDIKSLICSDSGKACQKIHGDKIRNNLNSGVPWNKGKKGLQEGWMKGLSKHTDKRIAKFAEDRMGEGNPMYGKTLTEEQKKVKSVKMQTMILDGTFTPNSNNRNTHWDAYYRGKKYRSSWEALFQYHYPDAIYEELRIPYNDGSSEKIYIVDFIDHSNKIVAEVKPKEMMRGLVFTQKMKSLREWAITNGYQLLIVNQDWILDKPEPIYDDFDEKTKTKIRKIYEVNKKN